jgi:hypothetical protein
VHPILEVAAPHALLKLVRKKAARPHPGPLRHRNQTD